MIQKVLFIINPISGIGKQKTVEKLIDKCIDKTKFNIKIAYTNRPKHATEIARNAAAEVTDIVVAVGGDGSVNEVSEALVNTNTILGIIPAGSGNGLARHLNIPLNIEKAITTINSGRTYKIDTLEVNRHFCVGIAGLGLEAHISHIFAGYKKRGFKGYLKIFAKEIGNYKSCKYKLIIDGNTFEKEAMLISIANSSQYGNHAFIAPLADITDGLADVCILKPFPKILLPYLGYQLFNKKIHNSRYFEIIKGKNIEISQPVDIAHIDGEPIVPGKNIHIKINPLSLKVLVP